MKKKFKFVVFMEVKSDSPKKHQAREILNRALETERLEGDYFGAKFTGYKCRNPRSRQQAKAWREREANWRRAVANSATTLGFAAWVAAQGA